MRHRSSYAQRIRRGARFRALLLAGFLTAVFYFIQWRFMPILYSVTGYQAKVYATRVMNDSISKALSDQTLDYSSFVKLNVGDDGRVSSIQTDMLRLNLIKTQLTQDVNEAFENLRYNTIPIPIGAFFGGDIFATWGPKINVGILPMGYVESKMTHHFDSAGINQTRHQIILEMQTTIRTTLPLSASSISVQTNVLLAETVIVGVSPDSFTQIVTDDADTARFLVGR